MKSDDTALRLYELQAQICQALGDPKRLRILHILEEQERSVGELADMLGGTIANVSQHLAILRARGLVHTRREGTSVYYSLAYPEILHACRHLQQVLLQQLSAQSALTQQVQSES